jgi:hypothetical protein
MPSLMRVTCLAFAVAMAAPALAQEGPATGIDLAKLSKKVKPPRADTPRSSGVTWECGEYIRCYSGIPLQCSEQTRPYQNIAAHQCLCIRAGCPQKRVPSAHCRSRVLSGSSDPESTLVLSSGRIF